MDKTASFPHQQAPAVRREWLIRLILLTGSLVFSIGVAEVVTRVFFPIHGGLDNVDMKGEPIKEWFAPGSVYRQVSNEYDTITTITSRGHRVPGTDGNPEVVFLGDSFTFGYGLKDDETFASIYCTARKVACANLGIPGSGTSRQVRRLEQFLSDYGWRPREVKLFFFGMSSSFSAGNDFVDNYSYGRRRGIDEGGGARREPSGSTIVGRLIGMQSTLLEYSYLMRQAKYHWGPLLKSLVVDPPGDIRMSEALRYTRQGLEELDALSQRLGFDYQIYLIVPVQDIIRGSSDDTLAVLNSVAPKPAIPTAQVLVDSPTSYYYAYDGHLNPAGSRRVAEFLISQDAH